MDTKMLDEKVLEIKKWENEVKNIQNIIDNLKSEIKQVMEENHVDEIITDTFKITWKEVKSNKFDSKSFKADNDILYKMYLKESVTKRFAIY